MSFLWSSPHQVEIVLTLFEGYFTYGATYEWNKIDERVRRLSNINMFRSEIKTV